MNRLRIRKGRETVVDRFELTMYCKCGGVLIPESIFRFKNGVEYVVHCNKCHKSTNAKFTANEYETFNGGGNE